MPKKMTWDEIKQSYPDEWVLLTDYEVARNQFTSAVVVAHHPRRQELLALRRTVNPVALVWTGKITRGLIGIHVEPLDRIHQP